MKQQSYTKRFRSVAVSLGVVASMVGLTASPARAASGSGGGTGHFVYDSEGTQLLPPCGEFASMTFTAPDTTTTLNVPPVPVYSGTYVSGNGDTYVGSLSINLEATGPFHANPTGLYSAEDSTCSGTPLLSIPVTGSTEGRTPPSPEPAPVGTVSCEWGDGSTFSRFGPANYTFKLVGTCSVDGGPATNTTEVHEGVLTACEGQGPPDNCDAVESYVAVGV